VKKHSDLTNALHDLKTFHRKLGEISGPYEKLNRGSLYEWFTPRRDKSQLLFHLHKWNIVAFTNYVSRDNQSFTSSHE
jgi:hypothetical protein